MRAYVLIQTEAGGRPIAQELRTIPGVVTAEDLEGAFDAIVLATAGSTRDLFDQVISKIRALPGVTRALPAPQNRALGRGPETDTTQQVSSGDQAA